MEEKWMAIPAQVQADPEAQDLLRVWGVREGQVFSIRIERWEDPAAWGILLADLARHIARSYAEASSRSEEAALGRVVEGFRAELPDS